MQSACTLPSPVWFGAVMQLTRRVVLALSAIALTAAAVSVTVYVTVIASVNADAKRAFVDVFEDQLTEFDGFFVNLAQMLRGVADAVSAMDSFPSHASFERVRVTIGCCILEPMCCVCGVEGGACGSCSRDIGRVTVGFKCDFPTAVSHSVATVAMHAHPRCEIPRARHPPPFAV